MERKKKKCTHCAKEKRADQFPPWGHNRKGEKYRSSFCHDCMLERRRRYFKTKNGKEAILRANRKYYEKKKRIKKVLKK